MKRLCFQLTGFMNFGITIDNKLVGDTNNSKDFRKLSIELPEGEWEIAFSDDDIVKLVILNKDK